MIEVSAKEFGPIRQAQVGLHNLTVFVGANNSGKSYLAMLLYSLFRVFSTPAAYLARFKASAQALWSSSSWVDEQEIGQLAKDFAQWLRQQSSSEDSIDVAIADVPESMRVAFDKRLSLWFDDVSTRLQREVARCYGAEPKELRFMHGSTQPLAIEILHDEPRWRMRVRLEDGQARNEVADFDRRQFFVTIPRRSIDDASKLRGRHLRLLVDPLAEVFVSAQRKLFSSLFNNCYYLPAARSGILQSHKALAAFVVSRSPLAGIEPMTIPRLTGVVTDLIEHLLLLERHRTGPLKDIAEELEKDLILGGVSVAHERQEYPEIFYESGGQRFPLHRTSSMVSELAPVVLFLKHLVQPDDVLILEEPESHLHPENQRRLARTLVKLVRRGVRVLITTHSDYFLAQLSNFIRAGTLSEKQRKKRGFEPDEYLNPEDVGTYLFELDRDRRSSRVRRLDVSEEEGIPEDEFRAVAEQLYRQTVALSQGR